MALGRRKYSRKVEQWEIDAAVKESEIPQPVLTRKATQEELNRVGRADYVEYEDNYERKYDNQWRDFERRMYANVR